MQYVWAPIMRHLRTLKQSVFYLKIWHPNASECISAIRLCRIIPNRNVISTPANMLSQL